jgi:tetratricopeptide (TPR) repeat protein
LGNLGAAYGALGEVQRAIGYFEQALAIAREIGNASGAAITSFNLALALSAQGQRLEALRSAEYAAQLFRQIGHDQNAQRAQALIAQIKGQQA